MKPEVLIAQAAVREEFVLDSRRTVITGLIDPEQLAALYTPWYQREEGKESRRRTKLQDAIQTGGLPDLLFNFRGNPSEIVDLQAGELLLRGTVSIIDGIQRINVTKKLLAQGTLGGNARELLQGWLGVKVHVGLTEDEEYELFGPLNRDQWRLAPTVTLRNELRRLEELTALLTYVEAGAATPIAGRVRWEQQAKPSELFSSKTYLSVVMALHGLHPYNEVSKLISGTRELVVRPTLGMDLLTANLDTFFGVIDECFGLRNIPQRRTPGEHIQIKHAFLLGLARFLVTHEEFWDGERLIINRAYVQRLKSFRFNEPVKMAAGSTTNGIKTIVQYLVGHFVSPPNSNSKSITLTPRGR